MTRDTITREEFEHRLNASNEQSRRELADTQERVRRLDDLIHRKEAFSRKLDAVLAEIEREEADIARAEKELRPQRVSRRRSHVAV